MGIIDISPPIREGMPVWPGDTGFSLVSSLSIAGGDNIDLSRIETTVHVGSHADAPSHSVPDGAPIDEVDLEPYLGPCQVIRLHVPRGTRIAPEDIGDRITAPRVLFRTGTFDAGETFDEDFAAFAPETIDFLAGHGVRLVGIDTPSMDLFDDRVLVAHHALARHGMANLECLVLSHVPAGTYTLIALPLKIRGADASPVRAILVTGEL